MALLLKPVDVPLGGIYSFYCSALFGVIHKLAEDVLDPIVGIK